MRLHIARQGSPLWHHCVELAQARYRSEYGAEIGPAPDGFLALTRETEEMAVPLSCAGMVHGVGRLLVENYLPEDDLLDVLTERLGTRMDPSQVVEVGPFASSQAGAGLTLLKMLPALLWCNGAQLALCTATKSLRQAFQRVGIDFHPLVPATEEMLPEAGRGTWGTYYETGPVAGYVDLRDTAVEISREATGIGHGLAVNWGDRGSERTVKV